MPCGVLLLYYVLTLLFLSVTFLLEEFYILTVAVLCANFFTEINQPSGGWLMLSFQPFYVPYIHNVMETFIAF